MARGPTQILSAFTQLPATRHPRSDSGENRLIIDSWMATLPAGDNSEQVVFLTIHGDFIEGVLSLFRCPGVFPSDPSDSIFPVNLNLSKSFDRTFIIAPAAPGSAAANAGWGYTIVNDQMHVRIWSQNRAWSHAEEQDAAAVEQVQPAPVVGQPAAQMIVVPGQTPEQALQLQAQNGLVSPSSTCSHELDARSNSFS